MSALVPLVVASYNVRRCRGLDGRRDPERIAAVLGEMDADVVGLQEVDSRAGLEHGLDQLDALARKTGLQPIAGPTLRRHDGHYGNGLLTRLPILRSRLIDLSVPGREPRGAIDVELDHRGTPVRIVVTHLGLRGRERRAQCIRLLAEIDRRDAGVTVLVGDLNEWFPPGRLLRRLHRDFAQTRSIRTFPAPWPLLALDRISVIPASALRTLAAHNSPLARVASDHLPLRSMIDVPPPTVSVGATTIPKGDVCAE